MNFFDMFNTKGVRGDRLLDILEAGIQEKKNGNYEKALSYYAQAQKIDPIDSRSYGNCMKIYIGLEKYELAFRNLLILCHYNFLEDIFFRDPLAKQLYPNFLPRFKWTSKKLTENHSYEPKLIIKGLEKYPQLGDLIYRADNMTFYCGHCYVGDFKDHDDVILNQFGSYSSYFYNLNQQVLGKSSGGIFRDTPQEGYFLSIGFIYTHMNINFALKTKQEIINYYLDPKTKIRKDVWNYGEFLSIYN